MVRTTRLRGAAAWAVAALLVAALAGGAWALGASQSGFVGMVFRDPRFLAWGAIVLGGLLALGALWSVLVRSGRAARLGRRRGIGACTDGTAMVEFALVFPIAMAVVMVMVQAMLMMSATVLVSYAAFASARTAIVWVPKDLSADVPSGYDPEDENVVLAPPRSYKLHNIRLAAVIACLSISGRLPAGAQDPDATTLRDGIERYYKALGAAPPNWVGSMVSQKLAYSWSHTRIQLEGAPAVYDANGELTVWVYHDYALLSLPVVGRLFGRWSAEDGTYLSTVTAKCTMLNEGVSDVIREDKFD